MLAAAVALALIALFSATGWALRSSWRSSMRSTVGYRRRVARATPALVPIERLSADLARLHAALAREENQVRRPAKYTRVQALRAAYLDVLLQACRQLDVTPPAIHRGRGMHRAEIFRVESALRERGLDVRAAVAT